MRFFACVLMVCVLVGLLTTAKSWGAHQIGGSESLLTRSEGVLAIGLLVFAGVTKFVWRRPIGAHWTSVFGYSATAIGLLAVVAGGFKIMQYQAQTSTLRVVPPALMTVNDYVTKWSCHDHAKWKDLTKVTCPIASNIEEFLLETQLSAELHRTEQSAERLITTINSSPDLGDKIKIYGLDPKKVDFSLEALVQPPNLPPELGEFQVVANYLASLRDLLGDVERRYRLPWGLRWVSDVADFNSPALLWLLFNAGLIQLALILSRVAKHSAWGPGKTSTAQS